MFTSKSIKIVILFLLVFSILLPLSVRYAHASPSLWSIEVVDSPDEVGRHLSLALDSFDRPHISYIDYTSSYTTLNYAWWDGTAWQIETVDTFEESWTSPYTSIALDSNDHPHIGYSDFIGTNWYVKYAYWTGTEWQIETVVMDGNTLWLEALALDSNDLPHIAYTTDRYEVWYARWTGLEWVRELVDPNLESAMDIAVDSNGYAHISYYAAPSTPGPTILKCAQKTNTGWLIEIVDSTPANGATTSIALDPVGKPRISYSDGSVGLKYAEWTGTVWSKDIVDSDTDSGYYLSLVLDSSDLPHIAYYDYSTANLMYAWESPTEDWIIETVDASQDVGKQVSLALDSTDHVHIAYFDERWDNLKYARTPDEYINLPILKATPDSSGDGYADSVLYRIDVDTTFDSSLIVTVNGYLKDPQGNYVTSDISSWTITSNEEEFGEIMLSVPSGSPIGIYTAELIVFDSDGNREDYYESITALLPPDPMSLTIIVTGAGSTSPSTGTHIYSSDQTVEIIAYPDEGQMLQKWILDGVDQGASDTLTVSMTESHSVEAVFEPIPSEMRALEIEIIGNGTTDPIPARHAYPVDSEVSITAIADAGWTFDHWMLETDDYGSENPLNITMDTNYGLTAVFTETGLQEYNLTVEVEGSGTTDRPPGEYTYIEGREVKVEAIPDPGWILGHWLLDSVMQETVNPITVTMDSNHTVTTVFDAIPSDQRLLFIEILGSGTITPDVGHHLYDEDAEVMITATPEEGWQLNRWVLDDVNVGAQPSLTLTMETNHEVAAIFTQTGIVEYVLTIDVEGNGTVDPTNGTYGVAEGSGIEMEAIPGEEWQLDHWVLDETPFGSTNPLTVVIDGNHTVKAVFTLIDLQNPVADAGEDIEVAVGIAVTFNAINSSDNVGIVNYLWDFGDGTTDTGNIVTHTYTVVDSYTVTLNVTDAAGLYATDTRVVTVIASSSEWWSQQWMLPAIGIVGLAAVVVLTLVVRNTRRSSIDDEDKI